MATNNCTTKAITLQAGEQFVLPPGATLIAATDANAIVSTCEIGDLETIGCYVALIGTNPDDGNYINYYEGADDGTGGKVQGYRLNNVDYEFAAPYNLYADSGFPTGIIENFPALATELKNMLPSIIAVKTGVITDSLRGVINYLFIKTAGTVASNLYIRMHGYLSNDAFQPNEVDSFIRFRPLSEVTGLGYKMMNPTGGPLVPAVNL